MEKQRYPSIGRSRLCALWASAVFAGYASSAVAEDLFVDPSAKVPDTELYDDVEQNQGFFYSPYYQGEPAQKLQQRYQLSLDTTNSAGNMPETDINGSIAQILTYHIFVNRLKLFSEYDQTGGATYPSVVNKRDYVVDEVVEWHFSDAAYWFGGGYWEENIPGGYQAKYGGKVGLGTYLVQNDDVVLRLEGGYHMIIENYVDPFKTDQINSWLLASDFTWNIGSITTLQAEVDAMRAVDDGRDLRFKSDVTLNINIIGKFGVMIESKINYDRKPVPGYRSTDSTLTTSFTYGM